MARRVTSRQISEQATDANANRARSISSAQQPNPNAAFVESTVQTNFNPNAIADPVQRAKAIEAQNAAIAAAKGTAPSTSERTAATRQAAGAPLQDPTSGINGQPGQLGFNSSTGENGMSFVQGIGLVPLDKTTPGVTPPKSDGTEGMTFEQRQQAGQREGADRANKAQEDYFKGEKAKSDAATDAAGSKASATTQGAQAFLQGLPPEASALAPAIQNILDTISQNQSDQEQATQAQLESVRQTYDAMDKKIADMESGFVTMQEGIQGMLDMVQTQQEEQISREQQAAMDRLAWTEKKALRKAEDEKVAAVDSKIASLAIRGGTGSDAGLKEIEETRAEYEQRIDDLQTEYGIQRTELSARFTGLYVEASNNYILNSVNNIRETASALERVQGQSLASIESRGKAEQSIIDDHFKTQSATRLEYAKELRTGILDMIKLAQDERAYKAGEEKEKYDRSWEQFKFGEEQAYRYASLQSGAMDREEAREVRRDDNERYKSEALLGKLQTQRNNNRVLTQYADARMSFDSLKTSFEKEANPFSDRAMAKSYEKLVEVGSVVMPGEYADIVSAAPLASKIVGKIQQVANGGQSWTDAERAALYDIGQSLFDAYQLRANEEAQIFHAAISFHNQNTLNPSYRLDGSMLNLPESSTSQQQNTFLQNLPSGYVSPALGTNPFGAGGGGASIGDELRSMGRVTQDFATELSPTLYSQSTIKAWDGRHKGIDIGMPEGTPIPSFVSGEVVSFGNEGGWGNNIVIKDDNGALHRLSHLSEFAELKKGDRVERGKVIGYSGNTGRSTGPHLDYRIRVDGEYVDPFSYSLS